MSEYSSLKAIINANVKTNENQEITGQILNSVLNQMVNTLGAGYQFMGVATPTNPGTAQSPDYKCFYLATIPGTYTNLGGLVVADGEVAILYWDTAWHKEVTGIASNEKLSELESKVDEINLTSDFGYDGDDALSFVDENDECIAQFKEGHIKTKEFDSRDSATRTYVDNKVSTEVSSAQSEVLAKVAELDNAENNDEEVAIIDESDNCIAQFKEGHIKTKNFDSRNVEKIKSFLALTIANMVVSGTASKNNKTISLGGGSNNRAYINSQLHNWHYTMSAKFRCTSGGVSFVLGKDSSVYGAYVEVSKDSSGSYLKMYNMGVLVNTEAYTLDFSLSENEDYLLVVSSDTTTSKIWKMELYGEYGEYFTYTSSSDIQGYGQPFVYSSSTSCTLKEYSFSVQRYYDVKDMRISILGHSLVEADSLGINREYCFANLLAQAVGEKKCINFGQGGLTAPQLVAMLHNCLPLAKYIQYAVIMIGGNDTSLSSQTLIGYVQEICRIITSYNIQPILCTQIPMPSLGGMLSVLTDMNSWVRNSGYLYCDMEQVFLDVDLETTSYEDITNSNIKTNLYLADNTHPTIEGNKLMFDRMVMDCPYLF